MLSLEGKQLGNYDVIRRIRVGGMGAVYEGRQRTAFDRRVAIKVILGDYASDRDMRRRFMREARTIARLHHPHILQLIEFGDDHGILYLVMPFIDNGTLTSFLRRHLPDMEDVSVIYQQLLDAVEYAHDEGLIHRDIKSSNVLLELRRNAPPYVYLADFGLVRTRRQAELEDTGKMGKINKPIPLDQVPGTPHYMAPEQTMGVVTPLTDIYALGVLLYQLLVGELPYDDADDIRVIQMHLNSPIPSPSDRDNTIPHELSEVVRKAMAKRAEDRYQSVGELRAAFLSAIKDSQEPGWDGALELFETEDIPPVFPISPTSPVFGGEPGMPDVARRQPPLVPPKRPVPTSSLQDRQAPNHMPRRARAAVAQNAQLAVRDHARTTETLRHRQRITEEPPNPPAAPTRPRSKPLSTRALLFAMIVPILLIILLLMPRLLGISFFPAGFPLFGTSAVATVYVTAQSKILQDSYILTASPQVKTADLAARTIPARLVQDSATDSNTVATTGKGAIGQAQAKGTVTLANTTDEPMQLNAQFTMSLPGGLQIRLAQDTQVPPHRNGHDGHTDVPAIVTTAGAAGNIPAHTIDGNCCNNGIQASNQNAFSGGSDGQIMHVVTQADLDNASHALTTKLQQQIIRQQHLLANEALAGNPLFKVTTTSSSPVGAQVDSVRVTVTVNSRSVIYNRDIAMNTAAQLLNKEAAQTLGKGYHIQGQPVLAASPTAQAGKNDSVYLSVPIRGRWYYILSPDSLSQWTQSIKGASSPVALAYLNQQPGVKSVEIHLPFGTDHFPNAADQISIIVQSAAP
jgi:serine/threonine protein kinase